MFEQQVSKNKNFEWTIRKKMYVFCMLVLLIPSLSISINSYIGAKNETDALIEGNLENSVKLMVQAMEQLNDMVASGALTLEQAQEEAKVMMLGAIDQDGRRPINPDIDLGENGYYFVLDEQGIALAHPTHEGQDLWNNASSDGEYFIQDIIKQGQSGGGFTFYSWPLPNSDKQAIKITYSLDVPEWNWIVAAGSYHQDFNQGQTRILYSTIAALLICSMLGVIGVVIFSNHISSPIRRIAEEAKKVAIGDLTSAELQIANRDEIGRLANDFNIMRNHLRSLVKQVMQSSDKVSNATQVLKDSIDETTQASRHIAESTQQIASGIDTQALSTEQSSKAMEEMALGIGRIADTSSRAYDMSVRTKNEAEQGYALIGQSITSMSTVQQAVNNIANVMESLNIRSTEISNIVTVMTDIASQTSLLSLNASIEAARAGEQGRGFGVVAMEVKKLAEMSKQSSEQISDLVHKVQSDILSASSSTDKGIAEFNQSMQVIEQTGSAFGQIVESTQEVVGQIQEASAAAEEMAASSEEIYASLQELERIAGRSAENSEMISAATEEQIATMEEIASSSNQLNQMADELKDVSHRFQIKD
jgi:methyl-accepting chemotaxis protein